VLVGIASDMTIKEIGAHLGISHKTVEYHWAKLKKTIGVQTYVAAALFARRHRIT
jgi:DNA-binding CsgD family transcriptional regulator